MGRVSVRSKKSKGFDGVVIMQKGSDGSDVPQVSRVDEVPGQEKDSVTLTQVGKQSKVSLKSAKAKRSSRVAPDPTSTRAEPTAYGQRRPSASPLKQKELLRASKKEKNNTDKNVQFFRAYGVENTDKVKSHRKVARKASTRPVKKAAAETVPPVSTTNRAGDGKDAKSAAPEDWNKVKTPEKDAGDASEVVFPASVATEEIEPTSSGNDKAADSKNMIYATAEKKGKSTDTEFGSVEESANVNTTRNEAGMAKEAVVKTTSVVTAANPLSNATLAHRAEAIPTGEPPHKNKVTFDETTIQNSTTSVRRRCRRLKRSSFRAKKRNTLGDRIVRKITTPFFFFRCIGRYAEEEADRALVNLAASIDKVAMIMGEATNLCYFFQCLSDDVVKEISTTNETLSPTKTENILTEKQCAQNPLAKYVSTTTEVSMDQSGEGVF